jgi:hypothetical protein
MARLPQPGSDSGTWGQVLNDFLEVAHQADGSLKGDTVDMASLQDDAVTTTKLQDNAVTTRKLQDSAVTNAKLDAGSGSDGQVLTKNSGAGGGLAWTSVAGSPDASSTAKGLVQLTNDLGGTATAPTVPGLAAKAADTAVVHNTGVETIAGVKTFSSSPVMPTPTTANQASNKTYVDNALTAKADTTTTDSLNTRVTVLESTGVVALTDAATIATDASAGKHFRVTVAGDRTLGAPTNATDGTRRIWEITASAADRSLTLATGTSGSFELTTGITSPITITNGKTLFLGAIYNASRSRWTVIAAKATS